MLDKRTNVLLTQQDHRFLTRLSQQKGKTIGHLIREAIKETYFPIKTTEKTTSTYAILQDIDRINQTIDTRSINYQELIEDGRKF